MLPTNPGTPGKLGKDDLAEEMRAGRKYTRAGSEVCEIWEKIAQVELHRALEPRIQTCVRLWEASRLFEIHWLSSFYCASFFEASVEEGGQVFDF